jgi:sugar lactone lactonase YvrE
MMMRNAGVAMAITIGMVAACAKTESKSDTTNTAAGKAAAGTPTASQAAPGAATKVGETDGLKTPESVRYDPELDVFYVSNINGNPSQHDNNGFIAIVRADSTSAAPKVLVEGGKNGVTLDAPKGLALAGDTLWVADINHVRAFNRRTGAKLADVDLSAQKAQFLNDVVIGGDGAVYVTDTGILFDDKGGMSHPGTDQIFRISGGKATSIKADSLDAPNGIAFDKTNDRFILGGFAGKAVQSWHPGDKVPATLATGPGQYDGVEVLNDGRILVTSWADSTVDVVQNGALSRLVSGVNGPADIGVDTKRMLVAVPLFNDNKVVYYKIP